VVVRGSFGAGDQRLQRRGNISSARVDGDHGVVIAAATFQETDHWLLRKMRAGSVGTTGPELWRSRICAVVKIVA
jgi:hypothetical protein